MKQIASFSKVEDAEMMRAFLEGEGIAASVRDGHTVTSDWTLSNAIGGVKVDVADEDAERATALIREIASASSTKENTRSAPHHTVGRYARIAAAVFVFLLILIAITAGFQRDASTLVISAGGTALAIATFLALFDV